MSAAEPLPCEDRYPFEPRETTTRDGALETARKIEAFWAARGKIVNTRVVNRGFSHATRGARFEVVSDMVDGYPNPEAKKLTTGPVEVTWERDQ